MATGVKNSKGCTITVFSLPEKRWSLKAFQYPVSSCRNRAKTQQYWLECSVADPDPGSGAFLTLDPESGSGIGKNPDPG